MWNRHPGRRIDGAGHIPFQDDALPLHRGIRDGDGRQQGLRIGMFGAAVELVLLRQAPQILPKYITATRSEMCFTTLRSCAMKKIRQAELFLQILEQVDHLRLDGYVQG